MEETTKEEALVIQGDDGAVYAIPRSQLEWYRTQSSASEVNGYGELNPQPLPPHQSFLGYKTLGYSQVLFNKPSTFIPMFNVKLAGNFRGF